MSDSSQPQEPEKTIFERDKTAKEPQPVADSPKVPIKPKPKIKKAFVATKKTFTTDKPMEHRVRNIRLTSLESAKMIWETLVDYQSELAQQEMDDPDKPFHDWEKIEKIFIRLAKKYSACMSKTLGGSLGWVYQGMEIAPQTMDQELIDCIISSEKFKIQEPIKTKLGFHVIMVCESQIHAPREKFIVEEKPPLF
ncbi:MAG: peptidylprolyl isomerase [Nitrospinae bacterium]|nr:peptidylprolyl isomerase [Nitrospinota bacterium]MBL7020267.1 peptidylprolyl isomerase [Nitrospinaceae bacterium]